MNGQPDIRAAASRAWARAVTAWQPVALAAVAGGASELVGSGSWRDR